MLFLPEICAPGCPSERWLRLVVRGAQSCRVKHRTPCTVEFQIDSEYLLVPVVYLGVSALRLKTHRGGAAALAVPCRSHCSQSSGSEKGVQAPALASAFGGFAVGARVPVTAALHSQ